MSDASVLSQEEIDALMNTSVDDDPTDHDDQEAPSIEGEVKLYDLAYGDRVIRGQFPTLEIINEKMARRIRTMLSRYIFSQVSVVAHGVKVLKYQEYISTLFVPTSVHLVQMPPLVGEAMVVLDARFVFEIVDQFFGGTRIHVKVEGREFSNTETRIIDRIFDFIAEAAAEIWKPILPISIKAIGYELNPSLVNLVQPGDIVVVSTFQVEFDNGSGMFQVTLPFTMLEPHRDLIDSAVKKVDDGDQRFRIAMEQQLLETEVNLACRIGTKIIQMSELVNLQKGDFIKMEIADIHSVEVNGVPALKARLGSLNGHLALEIEDEIG